MTDEAELVNGRHCNALFFTQKVASSRWVMLETILFGAILIYITVSHARISATLYSNFQLLF